MTDKDVYEILASWLCMVPMEQSVWATTFALHGTDPDGGVDAADAAVLRMRSIGLTRSFQPEPEYEAARSNLHIERSDFTGWYVIAHRMRHGRESGYKAPSTEQINDAYERYDRGLCDYY